MNQATRHMTPDAWLGVPLQLAIRDLAVVNGYAGALSVRTARRGTDAGRNRPLAVASVAVPSHGFTLLFRPLTAMEPLRPVRPKEMEEAAAAIPDRERPPRRPNIKLHAIGRNQQEGGR